MTTAALFGPFGVSVVGQEIALVLPVSLSGAVVDMHLVVEGIGVLKWIGTTSPGSGVVWPRKGGAGAGQHWAVFRGRGAPLPEYRVTLETRGALGFRAAGRWTLTPNQPAASPPQADRTTGRKKRKKRQADPLDFDGLF